MKQIFKSLGVCLGLCLAIQITIVIIVQIVNICIEDVNEINKYIYTITFIGQFIALYLMDLLNEKEKVLDRNIFKKISLRNTIYIILFGVGCSIVMPKLVQFMVQTISAKSQLKHVNISALEHINIPVIEMIVVIILIPICEEIIFRHVIFGYLRKNHNIVFAVVVQALFFGLWYGNIEQMTCAFIVGIFLALIYMRYKSLLGNITLHIVFNFMVVLIIPELENNSSNFLDYIIMLLGILCFVFTLLKMIPKNKKCLNK